MEPSGSNLPTHSAAPVAPPPARSLKYILLILDLVGSLFWMYVLLKLFVFDFDSYLIGKYLPEWAWLLNFKFILLIAVMASLLMLFHSANLALMLGYVIFFPLVVLFWKIPAFLVRRQNWNLAVASVHAAVSFFRSFKQNFIVSALCLVSLTICLTSTTPILLALAGTTLLCLLVITYVQRFILIFKPHDLFSIYSRGFAKWRDHTAKTCAPDATLKTLPVSSLSQEQLQTWNTNLETTVMFNRVTLFVARALRDYQNSGFSFASGIVTIFTLLLATVLSFAATNFALYVIDRSNFDASGTLTFFTFIYYSLNAVLFNFIKEATPATAIAQALWMAEVVFAFFLVAIFIALMLSVRSQRYSEELNVTIAAIEADSASMESFIRREYSYETIDLAIAQLEQAKTSMLQVLLFLTRNLKGP